MLLLSIAASAQHTIVTTESEFGKFTIFEDSKSPKVTLTSADGKTMEFDGEPGYTYSRLDDCLMQVKYNSFLAFSANPEKGIEDEMLLQIGTSISKYYSCLLHSFDSTMIAEKSPQIYSLLAHANPVFLHDVIYTDLITGETTFVCRFATEDFAYTDNCPEIKWIISEDTVKICGYNCRRAVGQFRGRTYDVWFTEDFPVSAGPWKLRGLPGIILSAKDTEGLCRFEAVSVEEGKGVIERPDYLYFKINREKYLSMLKQYFKSPMKFTSMHMSRAPGITVPPVPGEKAFPDVTIRELE